MKGFAWTSLYNCLYLISSQYEDIASLESPVFEIFEDLDTRISVGLNDESLSFFEDQGWINDDMKGELSRFRDFVNKIDSKYWNADDFDYLEDWRLARDWATSLMRKLKMEKSGWDSDGTTVIYTKD
jgi:hypothetical protein